MKGKKLLSALIAGAMTLGMAVMPAFAETTTVSFDDFIAKVRDNNGTYNGNGETIKITPVSTCNVSDCTECSNVGTKREGTVTKVNSNLAQYFLFGKEDKTNDVDNAVLSDISISNVNFEFVPTDFNVHAWKNWKGWSGKYTSASVPCAQMYLQNSGNVTVAGCKFDKVVFTTRKDNVIDTTRKVTVKDCEFNNIGNSYGLKDIQAGNIEITGNKFVNCKNGIMLSGATVGNVKIEGNTFNLDTSKGGYVIQVANSYNFDESSTMTVNENKFLTAAPVFKVYNADIANIEFKGNTLAEGTLISVDGAENVVTVEDGKLVVNAKVLTKNYGAKQVEEDSATGFITTISAASESAVGFNKIYWTVTSGGETCRTTVFDLPAIEAKGSAQIGLVIGGLNNEKATAVASVLSAD